MREGRRVANEDPRRVVHAFKVGLALVLVSSFYYYQPFGPFSDYLGINAMWAVMTVVVVFEFSVGATLGKGLNRAVATLVAGGLGIGAHLLASLTGPAVQPILLVIFVFLLAALSTFVRFFPRVNEKYDYGVLIFILTFALISLSGFRKEEIMDLAESRISTVMIPMDIKRKLEEPLRRMSSESGKSMRELSISIKKMTKSTSSDIHVLNSQSASKALSTLLNSGILNNVIEPLTMISFLKTVSDLLIDIVNLTEKISDSVHELASSARFKNNISDSESIGPIISHADDVDQTRGEGSIDSSHQHIAINIVR